MNGYRRPRRWTKASDKATVAIIDRLSAVDDKWYCAVCGGYHSDVTPIDDDHARCNQCGVVLDRCPF